MQNMSFESNPNGHDDDPYLSSPEVAMATYMGLVLLIYLLADLACLAAALGFYLGMLETGPLYFWLPFAIYVLQGVYQVYWKRRNHHETIEGSPSLDRWRLVIAILGWPCHLTVIQILEELLRQEPTMSEMTSSHSWLYWPLFFALCRWGATWLLTAMIPLAAMLIISQTGWF